MMEQQVKLVIGDRQYPFKIKADDEEKIRLAVKKIEERINRFRVNYPSRDLQDALSMALLHFAIISVNAEQNEELSGLINELKLRESQLSEYIDSI